MAQIEQKQLDGLVFRTSKREKIVEDGRKKVVKVPVERPLRPADILSQTDYDGFSRIVTKDGKKYDIPAAKTKGSKPAAPPEGSGDPGSPKGGAGSGGDPGKKEE